MRKQWKSLTGLYWACKCVELIWRRHLFLSDWSFTEPQLFPCCPAFLFTQFPQACPLTLLSLSPLISVYIVMRNHAAVARVISISSGLPVRMLCHDTETACEQKGNWEFWSKASEFTTCPTVHWRLLLQRIHTLLIFL